MKTISVLILVTALGVSEAIAQDNGEYPPNADPGSCFARVLVPETTEIVTEQVLDKPEVTEIQIFPAEYETITQEILVKAEAYDYQVIPAVYDTVTENVLTSPERTETVVIPAEYETYTEDVLIRPAYTTWKPGAGLFGRQSDAAVEVASVSASALATGELLCRVVVPAQYEKVTRQRIVKPETTETRVLPAEYKTITKQILITPAAVEKVMVPAVYETVEVQTLLTPAREEVVVVPAAYRTIEKRIVSGGGNVEWREVLCDTNASPQKIAEIQRALTQAGHSVPADGVFGPATLQAMEAYQTDNDLPVGYLTISTVEALGVSAE